LADTSSESTIPARVAYLARDGSPRITPTWFHWTGSELVMPTFIAAPHVARPARRLRDLGSQPTVAVTIDTETQPPQALSLRGQVVISEHDGVVAEYALAAHRYLGCSRPPRCSSSNSGDVSAGTTLSFGNIEVGPYLAGAGGLLALLAPSGLWPFRRRRSHPPP
jgi:hypothetical protein